MSFKFHPFSQQSGEDISSWLEQLQAAMRVAAVADGSRVQYLIAVIGAEGYKALKDLSYPEAPNDIPFETATRLLIRHFEPRRIVIAERAKFHTRSQRADESVSDYFLALKKLSSSCQFNEVRDPLSENLRDRFVAGLRSQTLRERLCEQTLNLTATYEKALTLEATKAQSNQPSSSQSVNALRSLDVRVSNASQHTVGARRANRPSGRPQSNSDNNNNRRGKRPAQPSQAAPGPSHLECGGCGGDHARRFCPHKNSICNGCQVKGHLLRRCRTTAARQSQTAAGATKAVRHTTTEPVLEYAEGPNASEDSIGFLEINQMSDERSPQDDRYLKTVIVEGIPLVFEVDTGSAVSVIPLSVYNAFFAHLPVRPLPAGYRGYGGAKIPMLGLIDVQVRCSMETPSPVGQLDPERLPLAVCTRPGAPLLMGRPWLRRLPLVINTISAMGNSHNVVPPQPEVLKKIQELFPSLFKLDGSSIHGFEADIHVKEGTVPVKRPAYSCPLALQAAVERELEQSVADNLLSPVLSSNWATPIVILRRPDGTVRLCGNYKVTVNPALEMDHYPLPNMEEMLTTISGKYFFVLDLHKAYLQMPVGAESQGILTWNTRKGLFKVLRLPYGIASAPAIFQNFIETVLKGLTNVRVLLDDVLGFAETRQECYDLLLKVLQRFCSINVKVRLEKCQLLLQQVKYLGNMVSSRGISPVITKVQDVQSAPPPPDVERVRSFLGLVNWHARFIPKLAEVAYPLIRLTRSEVSWCWDIGCQKSFEKIKQLVTADTVLVPYSLNHPLRVTCDASPDGLAAILAHVIDGEERVIAYASHTLTPAERNYAQIMREAAAIMFALKRFYIYLVGREFELVTDNRALASILGSKKGLSQTTIGRLQRWALILGGFQYTVVHRPGSAIPHADALSRSPAPSKGEVDQEINFISWSDMPVDSQLVAANTASDETMRAIRQYVQHGWPTQVPPAMLPFWRRRHELSTESDCLFWGQRLVIPESLRGGVLTTLHESHPGISRMKGLARGHVWWPSLDADLEAIVRECLPCQRARPAIKPGPIQSWPPAVRPWERIHMDHATYASQTLLVIVDAYSRWPIVQIVPSTDADRNIAALRNHFAAYGFPEIVVSDNGPPFSSIAFREFLQSTGTKYLNAPPNHPQTNGLAEEMVQTGKLALSKLAPVPQSVKHLQAAIDTFLLTYRTTPHTRTGVTPAALFLGREIRTRLSVMRPLPQATPSSSVDTPRSEGGRVFVPGDAVLVRLSDSLPWEPAEVISRNGNVTYVVFVKGEPHYVHRDMIRPCPESLRSKIERSDTPRRGRKPVLPARQGTGNTVLPNNAEQIRQSHASPSPRDLPATPSQSPVNTPRRSGRQIQIPQRLEYHRPGSPK